MRAGQYFTPHLGTLRARHRRGEKQAMNAAMRATRRQMIDNYAPIGSISPKEKRRRRLKSKRARAARRLNR